MALNIGKKGFSIFRVNILESVSNTFQTCTCRGMQSFTDNQYIDGIDSNVLAAKYLKI